MNKRFSIGRYAGIDVFIHWTFGILLAWIVYGNLKAGLNWYQVGWSVLFILSIFACVTLHEFGHALAARRFGIPTKDITLYPIGGVARLEKMPEKPAQELVVAIAGPAVNIAIMVLLYIFTGGAALDIEEESSRMVIDQSNFLPMLGLINVWLAFFNLIPAFPMDGGRVLRAFLSMNMDRVRATEIAATVGQILSILFIFIGFYVNPFLIFIGIFIMLGARSEAEAVRSMADISGLRAVDALMTNIQTIEHEQPLSVAVQALLDGQARSFLVTRYGEPYGYISREQIIKGIREAGEEVPVKEIAHTDLQYVHPLAPLETLYQIFMETKVPIILVRDDFRLLGAVDLENIAELVMVRNARREAAAN